MKEHICQACGYVFDEKRYGKFEDLPEDFECPECRADRDVFEEREKRSKK